MMSKANRRILIAATALLVLMGAAGVLSYVTTYIIGDGTLLPSGEWVVRVQNEQGTPLPAAAVDFLNPQTGRPVRPGEAYSWLFDNYTGPGSVVTDRSGVARLRNTHILPTGFAYWKLFWIWPIGHPPEGDPGASPFLRISASGYKPATVSLNDMQRVEGERGWNVRLERER